MISQNRDGFDGHIPACGNGLPLASVLWRRIVINGERTRKVAQELQVELHTAHGVMRILRHFGRVPSVERLAVVAMRVPDVTDADIAEMFGRPLAWAHRVRETASTIRRLEPMPDELEYVDEGYQPGDPSPDEIMRRAKEIRLDPARRTPREQTTGVDGPAIRSFRWRVKHATFVSGGPE